MKRRMSEATAMLFLMNGTAVVTLAGLWTAYGWPAALMGLILMFLGLTVAYFMEQLN